MGQVKPDTDLADLGGGWRVWPARWRWRLSLVLGVLLVLLAAIAWFSRERIAGDLIDETLAQFGLEASYTIESIGTRRQVIRDLVVGDPTRPDFTAEKVAIDLSYTFGSPELGRVEVVRPRLYGSFKGGALSFGSLDAVLFAESEEPAGLPNFTAQLIDARARIASDYGVIGVKIDGAGRLDDGFAGKLAATAPGVGAEGCRAESATAYGDVTSAGGRLQFSGPIRLRELACEGANLASADLGTALELSEDFATLEGDLTVDAAMLDYANAALAKLGGEVDFALGIGGELSLRHDLSGQQLVSAFAKAATIDAAGTLSSRSGFARNEWTGRVTSDGIDARGAFVSANLAELGDGTLVGALLGQLERRANQALGNAALDADLSLRSNGEALSVVAPEVRVSSPAGETILAMSRFSFGSTADGGLQELTGNIITGGADLPRITARLSQSGHGALAMQLSLAEYRAGINALTIPRLQAERDPSGRVRFTGTVQAAGQIPGGQVQGLEMPVAGSWSSGAGLALGTGCSEVKLESLNAYEFALGPQSLTLCPEPGSALVRYNDKLEITASVAEPSFAGTIGESPANFSANSATLRYPGGFELAGLAANIGSIGNAVRLEATEVSGVFDDAINGQFAGARAALDLVPLDISELSGDWSFADSFLSVTGADLTVSERLEPGATSPVRLESLRAENAMLTFADGTVQANASLFHPQSSRGVADIAILHDLASAKGRADIIVAGLGFDAGFQPNDLTPLTRGLIAFANGVITGNGLIEWEGDELNSSGTFSTDGFDFAAAFGPVRGVAGTIEFTDLLGMTTAPSQVATIASVNPGIEALDGRVTYSITDGTIIDVEDGRWPFMGGELILRPVTLDYGGGQGHSYIFEIIALDAATFVTQMELTNLGASGRFDGTIPIVFDAQGNGTIQGGLLISRSPGGNVSYVGELTYEDLGTMGNYAFQTLRSLDYNQMSIELNGNLAGEIVTNFNIDGVRQGDGTSQNFVTRQLAQLPIRFKINVRSENFYMLATIVRGLFDPTVFGNPIDQGLLQIEGNQIVPSNRSPFSSPTPGPEPEPIPTPKPQPGEAERRQDQLVQPPESDAEL